MTDIDADNDFTLPPKAIETRPAKTWGYHTDDNVQDPAFHEEDPDEVLISGVDDLPLFATKEATALSQEIKQLDNKVRDIDQKIVEYTDRLATLKEHFNNVNSELHLTNNLHHSKQKEYETEKHLMMLSLRGLEKEKEMQKKYETEITATQDKIHQLQATITKLNEQIENFQLEMNWNQNALEQWIVTSKQKEEDNLMLVKYTNDDSVRMKELNHAIEKLTKEYQKIENKLNNEVTETQAKQMELDRIANEFKQSHNERKELIQRWQDIINEMRSRDIQINEIGEKFAVAKQLRAEREESISNFRKRLQAQENENREVEAKFESLSRIVAKKREDYITGNQKLAEYRSELDSLKNELTANAELLVIKRSSHVNKSQLVESRKAALTRERGKYGETKEKLDLLKQSTKSVEIQAKDAELELDSKERVLAGEMTRLKQLKETLFQYNQQLHSLKLDEANLRQQTASHRSYVRNLEGSLHALDKEANKQQELLYNAEFQIQQIERKIARGMGERSDEEKKELNLQIELHEKLLADVQSKRKTLISQLRKLQNESASSNGQLAAVQANREKLTEKLREKELENKLIAEEIKKETKVKEEVLVANDLLRLDIKKLKEIFSSKADVVYALENTKNQLEMDLITRKQEISLNRDVLATELKTLQQSVHELTLDLKGRQQRVSRLQGKFELLQQSWSLNIEGQGPGSTDDGSGKVFQSYFIIQAAQKREELTRAGDELDYAIRQAERELKAQQLTLDHLQARNVAFRDSYRPVDNTGAEVQMLQQLQESSALAKDLLFRKRKELTRLITDVEEDDRRLEQVKSHHARSLAQRDSYLQSKLKVEDELASQVTQLGDFEQRIAKLTSKHRLEQAEKRTGMSGNSNGFDLPVTLEEKLVYTEVVKDCVQNVLYTLGQLSKEFPEVVDTLAMRLSEASLSIPNKPPTKYIPPPDADEPLSARSTSSRTSNPQVLQSVSNKENKAASKNTNTINPSNRIGKSSTIVPPTNFQMDF